MILIRDNVERIVKDEAQATRLQAEGYEVISGETQEDSGEKKLSDMKVAELKAIAKQKGIKGSDSLNKTELLETLRTLMESDVE